jgi:hypothetical protein
MDKLRAIVQVVSLFNLVAQVIQQTRDHGFQSVINNTTAKAQALVDSGHMHEDVLTDINDVLPAIVAAHPSVKNPDNLELPQSSSPAPKPARVRKSQTR